MAATETLTTDERLDKLEQGQVDILTTLASVSEGINKKVDRLETKVDRLEGRFDGLAADVAAIKEVILDGRK